MKYFKYTNKETDYLKKVDPILGKVIDEVGMLKMEIETNTFIALISKIISQQISRKAAVTVKKRFIDLLVDITAENIIDTENKAIQKCGISLRKIEYIKGIANASINKTIDFDKLHKLSDDEVIEELTKLKGVGKWTAEMILIDSLERQDILSYQDLGIKRGMERLYKLEDISKEEFEEKRKIYSPYGTIASFYIWKVSEN